MLESLLWQRALNSPEAEAQLHEMQADTLRLLLVLATVGYGLWHFTVSLFWPSHFIYQAYAIMLVALPALVLSHWLLPRSRQAATGAAVCGALLTIAWATYVVDSVQVAMLYVVLSLLATLVVHPLGGFGTVCLSAGILAALGSLRPGLVTTSDALQVGIFSALAVVGGWSLMDRLFTVLNWYAHSYSEAERRTREAEEHRGQLVQAWQQLDAAYYRLERANAALELAWKAADEAERSKMELAANISHELRTPLNLIAGYAEMMMTSPASYGGIALPAAYGGDLSAIYRSAQHLLALTEDVLDLARAEAGRMALVREPLDLGQVVRDSAALVTDYARSKGLEILLRLPDRLPTLLADRLRIRQVLLNLLANAARLTDRGCIEVRVIQEDQALRVEVNDTGPGIAPEDLPRVFERFVTRDPTPGGRRAGTGLGLPISRWFVELHGGEMGVQSKLGSGTTFWFTLPLAVPTSPGLPSMSARSSVRQLRRPEQVLVLARPDAELAHLLQRQLEGFCLEVADGLVSAQERARELRAAAILTDEPTSQLPDWHATVPVISSCLPKAGQLADRLGVSGFLTKPVSRAALLRSIDSLGTIVSRVLVVDDDTRFVRLLSRMLSSAGRGYKLSTAHNGEEGLARMRAEPPDLVLLDLAMPGLDGGAVLSQMAADPSLGGIKVIVVSAYSEGEEAVPLGTELHISKPEGFRLAELMRVVGAAINQMDPVRAHLGSSERAPRGAPLG